MNAPAAANKAANMQLGPQQTITLQAMHQEQLARLMCVSLPRLSSQHSKAFLRLAGASLSLDPSKAAEPIRYRRSLWDEDQDASDEPVSVSKNTARASTSQVLPEWYDMHNARCSRCLLLLVAGVNSVQAPRSRKDPSQPKTRSSAQRRKPGKKQPRRICELCQPRAAAKARSIP